jgi:hypothetical protein
METKKTWAERKAEAIVSGTWDKTMECLVREAVQKVREAVQKTSVRKDVEDMQRSMATRCLNGELTNAEFGVHEVVNADPSFFYTAEFDETKTEYVKGHQPPTT